MVSMAGSSGVHQLTLSLGHAWEAVWPHGY